jgi:transcriptional regulator with XRE-family HTH domain
MKYSTHLLRHTRLIIGQNIHHHRSKQKLPLRKLARITSLPEELIDHYELGKNEIRLDHLLRIVCSLNVGIGALVRNDEEPERIRIDEVASECSQGKIGANKRLQR